MAIDGTAPLTVAFVPARRRSVVVQLDEVIAGSSAQDVSVRRSCVTLSATTSSLWVALTVSMTADGVRPESVWLVRNANAPAAQGEPSSRKEVRRWTRGPDADPISNDSAITKEELEELVKKGEHIRLVRDGDEPGLSLDDETCQGIVGAGTA
jgi:hypothetical protein